MVKKVRLVFCFLHYTALRTWEKHLGRRHVARCVVTCFMIHYDVFRCFVMLYDALCSCYVYGWEWHACHSATVRRHVTCGSIVGTVLVCLVGTWFNMRQWGWRCDYSNMPQVPPMPRVSVIFRVGAELKNNLKRMWWRRPGAQGRKLEDFKRWKRL